MLACLCLWLSKWCCTVAAVRVTGQRGHAPRAALCRGRHLEGQDMEFWNLAAADELVFALQTVIFYTPNTPTLLQFWTTAFNCQWFTTPHKLMYADQLVWVLQKLSDWLARLFSRWPGTFNITNVQTKFIHFCH